MVSLPCNIGMANRGLRTYGRAGYRVRVRINRAHDDAQVAGRLQCEIRHCARGPETGLPHDAPPRRAAEKPEYS